MFTKPNILSILVHNEVFSKFYLSIYANVQIKLKSVASAELIFRIGLKGTNLMAAGQRLFTTVVLCINKSTNDGHVIPFGHSRLLIDRYLAANEFIDSQIVLNAPH